ncbi:glutaredoxin, putative [Eimeria brunetti]|uniref:Glutaredoxin, putative n=1 Tax=Eimeria brunetti TaxID=51314 RepID=U6LUV1_9EIME|nr:glutaredoxin, putative [Eimeria brunetti]
MAPTTASEVPKWVDGLIEKHKVMVFSKSYCPYCKAAISALSGLNIKDMHVEQIEDNPLCDSIQDYLKTKTGARSVPRVFLNGKFFGGGDDTVEGVKSGKIQQLLQA